MEAMCYLRRRAVELICSAKAEHTEQALTEFCSEEFGLRPAFGYPEFAIQEGFKVVMDVSIQHKHGSHRRSTGPVEASCCSE
jgi:hypothetical protein